MDDPLVWMKNVRNIISHSLLEREINSNMPFKRGLIYGGVPD